MPIQDMTEGYLDEVKQSTPAQRIKGHQSLAEMLDYLDNYASHRDTKCMLYKDYAPLSFAFTMQVRKSPEEDYEYWFNGGLIFFGPHETGVGDPQFSVRLGDTSEAGWSVHT